MVWCVVVLSLKCIFVSSIALRPFEVEWTGADEDARFDIDLFYCGSYSFCFDVSDEGVGWAVAQWPA